jgi:ketosteroid isomerase-like protein
MLRHALSDADLTSLGELMAQDVTWGDVTDPRGCRTRDDVMATFARLRDQGVSGEPVEMIEGPQGVLAIMKVRWPAAHARAGLLLVHQLYVVRDGVIIEIRGFDDRNSALVALATPE